MCSNFRIFTLLLLIIAVAGCALPPLGDTEADLALEDIAAGHGHSRLKAQTPLPLRYTVEYTIDGRHHGGDVYLSPQGARAGVVLLPGVVADGKDDSRLVALAHTLARLQFAVLVPDIKGLRRFHTRASDVRDMADAFRYLLSRSALVPADRVGLVGFSYGGGVALMAALEPDIREQVHYVMGFGGYHDLNSIVTYFTTGYYHDPVQGQRLYRHPHYYLKQVFAISNADLLARPQDREALHAYAYEPGAAFEPSGLAPDAQALHALLANEDPDRVASLIGKLSPRIRAELAGIDPSVRSLSQMRARVILLHGRADTMIPYTESIALARVLPAEQVSLFLIDGYAHTNIRPARGDLPQLRAAMQLLLDQRVTAAEITK